jgi:DNA-binding NtrC family response regulator
MQEHRPVITIEEARRRAKEAIVSLERGRPIDLDDLGDLISAVGRLADQFERSRREIAEVQAEVVAYLREHGFDHVPIIMVSAAPIASVAMQAGATTFLAKPLYLNTLLACVDHYLGSGAGTMYPA